MLRAVRAEKARRAAVAERDRVARDAEKIRARCQTLAGFVREAWHVLEPNNALKWSWHLDAMCQHLEAISRGELHPRLIINVPPGSSKSMIVSVLWQAWEWGPFGKPSSRFLTSSFEMENVTRDTRKTRDLIQSEWYRALWPSVFDERGRLTRSGETSFSNRHTGTREGVPFSSIMGKRGDRVVIDDPHSLKGAESPEVRAETIRLFLEGGLNRLNDQMTSAIVIVMQRVHEQDLTGALLARNLGFVHLMIPMEFEPSRRFTTPIGWTDPRAYEGELMDPVRMPREAVEPLKSIGEYSWNGQYQQRPAPRDGGLFKRDWLTKFLGAVPHGYRKRVRAWDLAATKEITGNNPSWTVGVLMSFADGMFLVEHVYRVRGSSMEVSDAILSHAATDGTATMVRLPQDPGQAGKSQAESLITSLAGYMAVAKPPSGDKATRATPAAVQAEAGNIRILRTGDPDKDAWIEPFIAELCLFPAGQHNDQVDAFADAFNELALGSRYHLGNL